MAELTALERRRNRLVHRSMNSSATYSTVRPLRDQVIQSLHLLQRPAALPLLNDVSNARWGEPIPTRRISSLRRDEQASFDARPGGRPVYIAAGLSADRFAPVRGVLSLSSWPLKTRIVGPASPRVDLLHNLQHLADELDVGRASAAPWVPAVERLVFRLARTVPGGLSQNRGDVLETDRVRAAVKAELLVIEPSDEDVRVQAADRARAQLGDAHQLFGVRLHMIRGDLASGEESR